MAAEAEGIWYRDPGALVRGDAPLRIFPRPWMSLEQQVNSVMRLTLYYAVIVFAIRGRPEGLVLPIAAAVVSYFVYELGSVSGESADYPPRGPGAGEGFAPGPACVRPTADNPFMNQPALEPSPFSAVPCDPLSPRVAADMRRSFRSDLFQDTSDLFERGSSERQFFTMPSNQPEDQTAFAEWIFGDSRRGGRPSRPPEAPGGGR